MHEQEFRQALRESMAVLTPPPMNENAVLDAAKRAVRRRRAMWASAASTFAVVALATGVALAAPGADRSGSEAGVEVTSTNPSSGTEPDWPDGQTDATASSGPRYEQGADLLTKLLEVVPPGYESPEDLTGKGQRAGVPLRYHQAKWAGNDTWHYDAKIPLVKAGEFGSLAVAVLANVDVTDAPCALSISALDPVRVMPENTDPNTDESCTEVTVVGKQVGVATKPGKMLVAYRHSDGTQVVLSQETLPVEYGYPGLTELPFTGEQLAALAADPRFHLD